MVALKKDGFSANSTNETELQQAKQDLIDQKPLIQAYVIDQVRDKMIGGEAAIGVIYSGEIMYIQDEVAAQNLPFSGIRDPGRGNQRLARFLGSSEKCEK